ncbi:MAG TPA: tetratricopeptide repeat protein [Devosia sp.]|nr:tetratricopeptide repeat protein [Devosia sp.]
MTSLKLAGALALAVTLFAAPALAIDTGGEDTTSTSPAPVVKKPAAPTLAVARSDIDASNWSKALADLKLIVAANPQSADAYNLMGFTYRNMGNYDRAGQAYAKALKLNPKHTGALEYQGVLFIKLGQLDKARANLDKIKAICGTTCEPYTDLAKELGG